MRGRPLAHPRDTWRELAQSIRHRGLVGTALFALAATCDLVFDWRHGVDTVTPVRLSELAIDSPNRERGVDSQATQVVPLRSLLRRLDLPHDVVFADLGCGKGRVLMVAATCGFTRLRGLEFAPALCAIARRNIQTFRTRTHAAAEFEVICVDVAEHVFSDEQILFLFNPFDATVLGRVLEHVVKSLAERPRPLWLIYRNAVHARVVDAVSILRPQGTRTLWGSDFAVWHFAP